MRMRRTVRNAWVKALRSGEYMQTEGALCKAVDFADEGSPVLGFCCLGVLSELAVKDGVGVDVYHVADVRNEPARMYDGEVNYPPASVAMWACPEDGDGQPLGGNNGGWDWAASVVDDDSVDGEPYPHLLADENDGGATFAQIADLIENDLDAVDDVRDDLPAEVRA